MAFYMFQGKYSTAAIGAMVKTPQDREEAGRKLVESVGGKLLHIFFCMGEYDVIALVDAPNDEAMAAASLVLGGSGAFSGGMTTKLMTPAEAKAAMVVANKAAGGYRPATA